MKKRRVLAFGEALLDMIREADGRYRAVAGGSVVNTAVSLSRLGVNTELISRFGTDAAGSQIQSFLSHNGVGTRHCAHGGNSLTPISLAIPDSSGNATYSFYGREQNADAGFCLPDPAATDILLFGSWFAVRPERSTIVGEMLSKAASAGTLIYYDVNIRPSQPVSARHLKAVYTAIMRVAHVVKGSTEDFEALTGMTDPDRMAEILLNHCRLLIITSGEGPVRLYTSRFNLCIPVQPVQAVSTIGAGDNFNAGFIFGMLLAGLSAADLYGMNEETARRLVAFGADLAAETCRSADNYIRENYRPGILS
jgi:fructokinase